MGAAQPQDGGRTRGREFLAGMYEQLRTYLEARPEAVLIQSVPGIIQTTYADLERALGC